MWLTEQERKTLTVVGAAALLGLGVLLWQRRRPPLVIDGAVAPAQAAHWDTALDRARRVDINAAGAAELERLPNVGPALAQRIVDYRSAHGSFRTPEELARVKGIGPATYAAVADHITVPDASMVPSDD